jgi:hypothetical protein
MTGLAKSSFRLAMGAFALAGIAMQGDVGTEFGQLRRRCARCP